VEKEQYDCQIVVLIQVVLTIKSILREDSRKVTASVRYFT